MAWKSEFERVRGALSGVGADLSRGLAILLAVACAGCGPVGVFELRPSAEVPILLGPPLAIGGGELAVQPTDEEYVYERSRASVLEEGRGNLFGTTGVVNGVAYVGRYDGIMIFFPVSNQWVGVEGEIVSARAGRVK